MVDLYQERTHDQIDEAVIKHAQRAVVLAQIEKRPPGYDLEGWTQFLMDLTSEQLRGRYQHRTFIEQSKLDEFDEFRPPSIPDTPPAFLIAKMRSMGRRLTMEELDRRSHAALTGLVGDRSSGILRAAQQRIQGVVREMTESYGKLPVRVKLHMTANNTFELFYEEVTVR